MQIKNYSKLADVIKKKYWNKDDIKKNWNKKVEKTCKYCREKFLSKKIMGQVIKNPGGISQENILGSCPECISENNKRNSMYMKEVSIKNWDKNTYIFNYFKGRLFPGISWHNLNSIDKEIIRTRVRLFKIQRKEEKTDETNRV